jgi:hypothetical protein
MQASCREGATRAGRVPQGQAAHDCLPLIPSACIKQPASRLASMSQTIQPILFLRCSKTPNKHDAESPHQLFRSLLFESSKCHKMSLHK